MKVKVSKEKIVMSVTIGIACFALMLVMFMQFKVVQQTDITAIETMKESELRIELKSWNDKYDELNGRYEELVSKIEEYKTEKESDAQTYQLLENELEQLNEALGKTDVEGEGIVIQLTDKGGTQLSEDVLVEDITSTQLLTIINELFSAGAEAVSLNGHRITSMTAIYEIGTKFLKVNGDRISSPYIINAIGNADYLKSAVSGKGGGVDQLKELGHETSVDTNKKIKIEKYDKDMISKYIN
mgnify:CR=1 FL=1